MACYDRADWENPLSLIYFLTCFFSKGSPLVLGFGLVAFDELLLFSSLQLILVLLSKESTTSRQIDLKIIAYSPMPYITLVTISMSSRVVDIDEVRDPETLCNGTVKESKKCIVTTDACRIQARGPRLIKSRSSLRS